MAERAQQVTRWYRSSNAELAALVASECVQRGEFRLASGQVADYYVDMRKATMSITGIRVVGQALAGAVLRWLGDREGSPTVYVGGVADGGIALVAALLATTRPQWGTYATEGFWVRKKPKLHGTQQFVEGYLPENGEPCILVEDVVTTGGSVIRALTELQKLGVRVDLVLSLLHRGQWPNPFETFGCQYLALLTPRDLGLEGDNAGRRDPGETVEETAT